MMSFFNDLLKFQMAILQIHCYFLLSKTKINSVFAYVVGNELRS